MDYKDLGAGQNVNHFWFRAKNDLIKALMNRTYKEKRGLKILNLGAGTGDDLKVLSQFGSNYVIDIDQKALSVIKNEICVEKKLADACNLPYGDNFFDTVVAFDVFEHIEDDKKAIEEVHRVLKPNGILIFSVPAFLFLFSSHDKALNHFRRYNKKSVEILMSKFDHIEVSFWNFFLFFPIAVIRMLRKNKEPKVDKGSFPRVLNTLFYKILSGENILVKKGIHLPIGLSVIGICNK